LLKQRIGKEDGKEIKFRDFFLIFILSLLATMDLGVILRMIELNGQTSCIGA
jgi:hypothetical protein